MMARRPKSMKLQVWADQGERCYWCLCLIIFHTHVPGEPIPDNAATVDHVYPAWHPKRIAFKNKGMPSPFVMACHSCNNKRGGISFKKYHELIGKPFVEPQAPRQSSVTRSFNNLVVRGFKRRRN
jgi:hypothetical protein